MHGISDSFKRIERVQDQELAYSTRIFQAKMCARSPRTNPKMTVLSQVEVLG